MMKIQLIMTVDGKRGPEADVIQREFPEFTCLSDAVQRLPKLAVAYGNHIYLYSHIMGGEVVMKMAGQHIRLDRSGK